MPQDYYTTLLITVVVRIISMLQLKNVEIVMPPVRPVAVLFPAIVILAFLTVPIMPVPSLVNVIRAIILIKLIISARCATIHARAVKLIPRVV